MQPHNQLFVEILKSGLQDRILLAPYATRARVWQVIYLQSGSLEVRASQQDGDQDDSRVLSGPGLLCHPVSRHSTLVLTSGSVGGYLVFEDMGMSAVVGNKPEATELRLMAEETAFLALGDLAEVEAAVAQGFSQIVQENQTRLPGYETVVEAQLRCLLVILWRHSYHAGDTQSADAAQTLLLRRFRQLVETHFRSRWRVADYAHELGTTADRLHSVATRALGRAPLTLIHERTLHEARTQLERSNLTVEQIALVLGFHSASQFSSFFTKHEGVPPGRFRKASRLGAPTETEVEEASLRDWP